MLAALGDTAPSYEARRSGWEMTPRRERVLISNQQLWKTCWCLLALMARWSEEE